MGLSTCKCSCRRMVNIQVCEQRRVMAEDLVPALRRWWLQLRRTAQCRCAAAAPCGGRRPSLSHGGRGGGRDRARACRGWAWPRPRLNRRRRGRSRINGGSGLRLDSAEGEGKAMRAASTPTPKNSIGRTSKKTNKW
jgi:hypothetical protein